MAGGKLSIGDDGILPVDPETGTELTGFSRNWWVGLGLLHTVFAREHNAICDLLAEHHPAWDDETLFQTARLVNAAVMAKIHTIEWTPATSPNHSLNDGMMTQLVRPGHQRLRRQAQARPGGHPHHQPRARRHRRQPPGHVREVRAERGVHGRLPAALAAARRGAPRRPRRRADRGRAAGPTRHAGSHRLIGEHGIESLARSFGQQLPGALVTNNYPASMQDVSVPGVGVMDLGSVDLYRDRERGVPTFNQLRREIGLKPVASFDDLIDDPGVVADLRDLYGTDAEGRDRVDDMDLLIGTLAESHRPTAFGFGETLFQIFILNASWRLLGDRFYTDDFRAEVYTAEGLDWIDRATFKSVLLRNIPALATTGLANVANAFEPWDEGRLSEERHPLRGCTRGLGPDPWAGDASAR